MMKLYIGLEEISGPLIFLDGVKDVGYEDMVEIQILDRAPRYGRVILIEGDRIGIQVFEGTQDISLTNTKTRIYGKPVQLGVSKELLGRTFSGSGKPLDNLGDVFVDTYKSIHGLPLNPVSRVYPKNFIQTGISSIDGLTTLIRGQKLPIFSGAGLPHNELAVQIVKQAKIADEKGQNFGIVFAAMGVKHDVAAYFKRMFEEVGVMQKVVMFVNVSNEPIIERILTPRFALTAAEYLAFEHNMHILTILTDMTAYCEALREFSSSKGEIPGRKGYPGYLYSDLASLYERAGIIKGGLGSVTQIPIITMPNDDITHPIPDLTGYITEGQIVLSRTLHQQMIYPPIDILPSLSRLMKDGIGAGFTRDDHSMLTNQLFASYARVQEARDLASVIGEDELSDIDLAHIKFGRMFEKHFLTQHFDDNRQILDTLDLGWDLLSLLPESELDRVEASSLKAFYHPKRAFERFYGVSS
jgi:V/A-type H+-transporting ATPase subunit B